MDNRLKKVESVKDSLDRVLGKRVVWVDYDLVSSWDAEDTEARAIAFYLEDGGILKLAVLGEAIITDYEEAE